MRILSMNGISRSIRLVGEESICDFVSGLPSKST